VGVAIESCDLAEERRAVGVLSVNSSEAQNAERLRLPCSSTSIHSGCSRKSTLVKNMLEPPCARACRSAARSELPGNIKPNAIKIAFICPSPIFIFLSPKQTDFFIAPDTLFVFDNFLQLSPAMRDETSQISFCVVGTHWSLPSRFVLRDTTKQHERKNKGERMKPKSKKISGMIGMGAVLASAVFAGSAMAQTATGQLVKPNLPPKKLIEYGWDLPSPDYLCDNIRAMEQTPFEGVIFRMKDNGGQIFKPEAWDEKKLTPQLQVLSDIKWGKFTDNFLSVYAASTMDWFSDSDWKKIIAHTKFAARAAEAAHCKGIMFDPEPYGNNPWNYSEQKHAKTKTFLEYSRQARKRGAQFMRALSSRNPDLKLLMFYQYSMFYGISHDADPLRRAQSVNSYAYGLMAPFLDGMLEVAGSGIRLIDGNEHSYYYKTPLEFYRAHHTMKQSAKLYVAPELRAKFDRQVNAAQALYVDYVFDFRPDIFKNNVASGMTPEERARWFEHNTYYALQSSDEYVWLYSENMNWWTKKNIPPGMEAAIVSAKEKVARYQDLGFDLLPTVAAAQARVDAALQAKLLRRNARIARLPAGEKPVIDGKLDDAAYKKMTKLEPFVGLVNPMGEPPALKAETDAWAGYDADNLYIAFQNHEPAMKELKIVGEGRDSTVWSGDSVEISIQPDTADSGFYHFILGPSNVQWDAMDKDKTADMSFNPNWKSATSQSADGWIVEVAIPWRELKMSAPKPGETLHVNLARMRMADKTELSSWSQFIGGFQEAGNFGTWTF
jgi:hypothetical protein